MKIHVLQHVPYEGLAALEPLFQAYQIEISRTYLYQDTLQLTDDQFDFDVLMIMGGKMGVHDEALYPWLKIEKQFIKRALNLNKKIVGICLGAQLVADALGARVYQNSQPEIGWFPIHLSNDAKICHYFNWMPNPIQALHWHQDCFELPSQAINLGFSDVCPCQGFIYQDQVLALQCHLEMTQTSVQRLIENDYQEANLDKLVGKVASVQSPETMLGNPQYFDDIHQVMTQLIKQFLQLK